ncbi:MAG: hypothetical protein GX345_08955 [Clostridiales bacterium]|nr:hypothetical protein [Clostridiales bacterium]
MTKKVFAILFAALLPLSLFACDKQEETPTQETESTVTTQATTEESLVFTSESTTEETTEEETTTEVVTTTTKPPAPSTVTFQNVPYTYEGLTVTKVELKEKDGYADTYYVYVKNNTGRSVEFPSNIGYNAYDKDSVVVDNGAIYIRNSLESGEVLRDEISVQNDKGITSIKFNSGHINFD